MSNTRKEINDEGVTQSPYLLFYYYLPNDAIGLKNYARGKLK